MPEARHTRMYSVQFHWAQHQRRTHCTVSWVRTKFNAPAFCCLTSFVANPNLEGEIHLKGGRFVTSQISNLECYTLDHHCIAYFIAFWQILENPKQLKDPRRELGIFPVFILDFYQIIKRGFLV